jgi:flavin-dependent dehydrogenase
LGSCIDLLNPVLNTDVAIVGAGPAGTATAISCLHAGLKVVILEREGFPRHRPGETLHPGIEALFKELGVAERVSRAGFLRHEGIWVRWAGELRFVPYGTDPSGPWQGFQAWRADLDAILLERARELGAEILQPCRALHPTVSNGRVSGIDTNASSIKAGFVIDAAGCRHWLARWLGLDVRRHSPRLIARYGYLLGTCPARDGAPAIVADEEGWTWTARVGPGLYHWTRLNSDGSQPDADFVPDELGELKQSGPTRGADVGWRVVRQAAGPGYFLVGDAAAVQDPASSHGVLKAVLSGLLAGQSVAKVLMTGCREEIATRRYRDWVANWFANDVVELGGLYARSPKAPWWLRV